MAVNNAHAIAKARRESMSESDSLIDSSGDYAASGSLSSAANVSIAPSSASSKQPSHLAQVPASGAAPTTITAPRYKKAANSTVQTGRDVDSDEENGGNRASACKDTEETLASFMGGVALDEGSGPEFEKADARFRETGDGGDFGMDAQTATVRTTANDSRKAQRMPGIELAETKLDKAIREGKALKVKMLLASGTGTANWTGMEAKAMKRLPKLFAAKDEAALLAAIEKNGFSLDELSRANSGTDLLHLACRINSVKLARAWINAHAQSLEVHRLGNTIVRRTELEIPIKANSMPIIRLMLDLGAIPGAMEIAIAHGEIKDLLQQTYETLPFEQRYD